MQFFPLNFLNNSSLLKDMPLPLKVGKGRGFFKKTEEEKDQFIIQNRLRKLQKTQKKAARLEAQTKDEQEKMKKAQGELALLIEEAKKKYPDK